MLALTVSSQLVTQFLPLRHFTLPAAVSNPISTASADSSPTLCLAWSHANQVIYSVTTEDGQCISCDQVLDMCWAPRVMHMPGTNLFVVACLTSTSILVKLLSSQGRIQTSDVITSSEPQELSLVGLASAQVLLTYTAQDANGANVYWHIITRNGAELRQSARANLFTQDRQTAPLSLNVINGFFVLWESNQPQAGAYGQYFDYSGKRVGTQRELLNRTAMHPIAMTSVGSKLWVLYEKPYFGEVSLWLQDVSMLSLSKISGIPTPIWHIVKVTLVPVSEEYFLLGLSYTSPSGLYQSLILAIASSGCHFTSVSLASLTGSLVISDLTVSNATMLLTLVNDTAGGFTRSHYSLPAPSICLTWTEPLAFPLWFPQPSNPQSVPEVLIAVCCVFMSCFLLFILFLWIRRLLVAPLSTNRNQLPAPSPDLNLSGTSLVQLQEFKSKNL